MIQKLKKSALEDLRQVQDSKQLEEFRVKYLGRKGELTQILRGLKDLSIEERREVGLKANELKEEITVKLEEKLKELAAYGSQFTTDGIDVTRPGKKVKLGHLHLLTKVEQEIRQIFLSLNFSAVEGPEVENEYYNFDALNIPADHPARDMWDTFWLKPTNDQRPTTNDSRKSSVVSRRLLLRTHTSPMQIRYMEKHEPSFQIIVPGRVFRHEATDASHEANFYQVEGLMVGSDVSLANFKYIIEEFLKKFFGSNIEFRYRPSYFPFVEPGIEVDIKFKGKWLEMMGAGMVHSNVFKAVRYDSSKVQGFAFGMGLERFAMVKYSIPDIRLFYSGDLRFIEQF